MLPKIGMSLFLQSGKEGAGAVAGALTGMARVTVWDTINTHLTTDLALIAAGHNGGGGVEEIPQHT